MGKSTRGTAHYLTKDACEGALFPMVCRTSVLGMESTESHFFADGEMQCWVVTHFDFFSS